MNDSENKKNNFDEKPITTVRRGISDIESTIFGVVLGVILLIAGGVTITKEPLMSLALISMAIFPICEVVRGIISFRNKTLISSNNSEPTEQKKLQMQSNDKKLKVISKIKILSGILTLIFIVLAIIF